MTFIAELGFWVKDYAWSIILGLLLLEILAVIAINRTHFSKIVPQQSYIGQRSEKFRTHALTLAGMAFTVIALLVTLADNPAEYADVLDVLAVAIGLLFFVFEVDDVTETTRIWFMLQEKSLGYGFLSLFIAVILLYFDAIPGVSGWILIFGFVIVAIIRFSTVWRQFHILQRRKTKDQEEGSSKQGGTGSQDDI